MPRVVGVDPGTVTVDLFGLEDGRVFLDLSIPTAEALASPSHIPQLLEQCAPLDLVVGPSGYGLPLTAARDPFRDLRDDGVAPAVENALGVGARL